MFFCSFYYYYKEENLIFYQVNFEHIFVAMGKVVLKLGWPGRTVQTICSIWHVLSIQLFSVVINY